MPDPVSYKELQRWENLAGEHVIGQPLLIALTEQGMAVAELARAVPRLLHLIRMERQDAGSANDRLWDEIHGPGGLIERVSAAEDGAGVARGAIDRVRKLVDRYQRWSTSYRTSPETADVYREAAIDILRALDGES